MSHVGSVCFLSSSTVLLYAAFLPFAMAGEAGYVLEEIVITAQKREERLQDVPVAVTAFSARQIESAGIETAEDFLALTPNVFMANSFTVGNSFVTIRGVSQINNGDPSVAVVVDGVPQSNQKQLTAELFDVERIEVLKGPQGALYGRNAIGGAINIVTKQPGNEFAGFARAGYGNGNAIDVAAGIGGPIVKDKVLFRIAGSYKDFDGLIENVFLNEKVDFYEDKTGRAQLKVSASESLNLDLRASYAETEGGAVFYSVFPTNGFSNDTSFRPDQNALGSSRRETIDLSAKIDWDIEFATVTGIVAYTDLQEDYFGDLDLTNPDRLADIVPGFPSLGQGQDLDLETISYELRLTSPDQHAFRWIAGAYLLETDRTLVTTGYIDVSGDPDDFVFFISGGNATDDNRAYAFFGQLEYDVSEQLVVQAALRYDNDRREQLNNEDADPVTRMRRRSFDDWQPKVTIKYNWSDDVMTYATVSTGFRSGGYNSPNPSIVARGISVFEDETLTNYEVGFKSTLLDRRLIVNAAAFYQEQNDYQFFMVDFLTGSQIIQNIDKVNMRGVEIEFQALLADGLDIFGGFGLTDSEIKKYAGSASFVGNEAPTTPKYTINFGAQYMYPVAQGLDGVLRVDYQRQGKKYWHADNSDFQKPVDLVNVRLGIESEAWSLTGWVENLFREDYFVEYGDAGFSGAPTGLDLAQLGPQRTWGVEGKVKF